MTYQGLAYFFLLVVVLSCGSAEMEEEYHDSPQAAQEENAEVAEEYSKVETEYSEPTEQMTSVSVDKWKTKAQQQLESIEDLVTILKDPVLDPAFKVEIEKQLNLLYNNQDSVLSNFMANDLKFKKFKPLQIESGDTMSISFKNKKELLKAKFVVVFEEKDFGETTEVVERLSIISIEVEE
jgi:hypothetical protein